jgi:hypothetical protein
MRCPLYGRPGRSVSAPVSAWPCDQMPSDLHPPWLTSVQECCILPVHTPTQYRPAGCPVLGRGVHRRLARCPSQTLCCPAVDPTRLTA